MAVQKTYALVLGIVLGIVGIWGFFTQSILGIFGVNTFQSILHVIAGLFGIYVGTKGEGPGYNATIGWIGVILAVLGFIPATASFLVSLLNINIATTWLHLVIGIVSLLVYFAVEE
jgi:hypothetical protein